RTLVELAYGCVREHTMKPGEPGKTTLTEQMYGGDGRDLGIWNTPAPQGTGPRPATLHAKLDGSRGKVRNAMRIAAPERIVAGEPAPALDSGIPSKSSLSVP